MNPETLLLAMNGVDETLLHRSERRPLGKRLIPIAVSAAVLCLALTGYGTSAGQPQVPMTEPAPEITQTATPRASDYFRDSKPINGTMIFHSESLHAQNENQLQADYSDQRKQLEAEGVIPIMEGYEEFDCIVTYENGELLYVRLRWGHRGTREEYRDMSIITAPQEVEIPECDVSYCVDEEGNIIELSSTITERDGTSITGVIEPGGSRTLTFRNKQGWYKIEGSFNDTEDSVVALLDWLWEHPIPFEDFSAE